MVSRSGRLVLVRHAESEGNRDRRFTMTPAVPITDLGSRQAEAAGDLIAHHFAVARIVASPFRRARQTAEPIAVRFGLAVDVEPDVRERDFGEFAGRPYESVLAEPEFASGRRWEWRPAGGESLVEVRDRAAPAVERIALAHPGQDVVVVSHGGVMMALQAHFAGTWEGIAVPPNCGIIVVEHADGVFGRATLLDTTT